VEEPNAYAVANWHTIEAHEIFAADKERLHRFVKMFEASGKDGILHEKIIHVSWDVSAALLCLGAPVTQIRKVKAREGVSLDAVQATLDRYVNTLTGEAIGATYGQVIENPEEIGLGQELNSLLSTWICQGMPRPIQRQFSFFFPDFFLVFFFK